MGIFFSNSMLVEPGVWPIGLSERTMGQLQAMKALLPVDECCSAREVGRSRVGEVEIVGNSMIQNHVIRFSYVSFICFWCFTTMGLHTQIVDLSGLERTFGRIWFRVLKFAI